MKITETAETKRTLLNKNATFRAAEDDSGQLHLRGYFIVFDSETELFDEYYEQISPDAIADDIQDQDIRALFDHDTAKVLGRTVAGTLTLAKDKKGLIGDIIVNQDDPEAMSVYQKVKRGDVSQASFGFFIKGSDENERDDGWHTVITSLELLEVSIVTFPAYSDTEIGARSKDIESFKQQKFDARKSQLIKELKEKWKIQS